MGKFAALLSLSLKSMLSSLHIGGRKRARAASGIGVLVFMTGLACYCSVIYSFMFARQLAEVGMLPVLMLIMPFLAVLTGFFFTAFGAQGVIFGGRDNDLMLSLPISPSLLLISRIIALYLENLAFALFIMLPAGIAYLFSGGKGGIWFGITMLTCTAFLALLPTLLSLVCGFALAWLSSKFSRRAWLSTILYFILFGLLTSVVLSINTGVTELASIADDIQINFAGWGLPFLLLQQAVCYSNPLSLLGFMSVCLLPFIASVLLFAGRYKRITTNLSAKGARSDYRLGKLSESPRWKSLVKREAARYFSTPIYIFNTGIGLLIMLISSVAALVLRGKLDELMAGLELNHPVMPLLTAGLTLLISTVAITASTISLEGKYLWILKEAPVSTGELFAAKAGFQITLCLPFLLLACVCLGLAFSLTLFQAALMFLTAGIYSALSALIGLYINLCFPKLDAPNDAVVVKQSAAAIISPLVSILTAAAGIVVYLLIWRALDPNGAIALCAVLFAGGTAILALLLKTKGQRMFCEL